MPKKIRLKIRSSLSRATPTENGLENRLRVDVRETCSIITDRSRCESNGQMISIGPTERMSQLKDDTAHVASRSKPDTGRRSSEVRVCLSNIAHVRSSRR